MKIDLRRPAVRQFLRYLIVGVMNTLVTLVVIYLCKSQWGVNQWVSNGIGYVAGLINSFVWNKLWVSTLGSRGTARQPKDSSSPSVSCSATEYSFWLRGH